MRRPTWWLPLVIWGVLAAGAAVLVTTRVDWEGSAADMLAQRAAKGGPSAPAGAEESMGKMMRAWGLASTPFVLAGQFFLVALVLWVAARAFGGEAPFGGILAIWAHANLPNAVGALLMLAVASQVSPGTLELQGLERLVKSSAAAFLPESASPVLVTLASSLDVFSLATLALLVIGFRQVPGLPRGAATSLPIALWLVWVLFKTGGAFLRS